MCRFIETIQLKNGNFLNLHYHQERMNRTISRFFGSDVTFDLRTFLTQNDFPLTGKYRCTLIYTKSERFLKIIEYKPKEIKFLRLRTDNDINYSWKFANRDELNRHLKEIPENEEIIIIKNGFVTDASYANLVFYDGKDWYTPSSPLLHGTKRRKLLDEGKIKEKQIRSHELKKFIKCSLINAMLDIGEKEVPVSRIIS